MSNCNGGCDMRPDRIIPPTGSTGIDGGLGFYQPGGFGNVLIGNPRGEPVYDTPKTTPPKVKTVLPATSPATAAAPGAAAALATSTSSSPILDGLKEHWGWLVVAGLVGAALWVKA